MTVFLGGTCNGSEWRDVLIPMLEEAGIEYFNPVVADWNEAAQARERFEREQADVRVYTITPAMTGVFSIAELIEDVITHSHNYGSVIFTVLVQDKGLQFTEAQIRSLIEVGKMVMKYGGKCCTGYPEMLLAIQAHAVSLSPSDAPYCHVVEYLSDARKNPGKLVKIPNEALEYVQKLLQYESCNSIQLLTVNDEFYVTSTNK